MYRHEKCVKRDCTKCNCSTATKWYIYIFFASIYTVIVVDMYPRYFFQCSKNGGWGSWIRVFQGDMQEFFMELSTLTKDKFFFTSLNIKYYRWWSRYVYISSGIWIWGKSWIFTKFSTFAKWYILLIYNPFHKDTEPTIYFGYGVTSEGRSI